MIIVPILLLLSMAAAQQFGVWLRHRHNPGDDDTEGLGVVDAAVFGLMGLLLAFSFSAAAERFDARRKLVVQEANDIGTAYMRLSLLPAADQPALRQKFREYLDSRLDTYKDMKDIDRIKACLLKSQSIQNEIWTLAVASAAKSPTTTAGMLLLPSLNEMFDTMTDREGAMRIHTPGAVFVLLVLVLILCAMLAGFRLGSTAHWSGLHRLSFVVILALTYYFIIDLEHPRLGLITVSDIDLMLVQVRQSMQ